MFLQPFERGYSYLPILTSPTFMLRFVQGLHDINSEMRKSRFNRPFQALCLTRGCNFLLEPPCYRTASSWSQISTNPNDLPQVVKTKLFHTAFGRWQHTNFISVMYYGFLYWLGFKNFFCFPNTVVCKLI